MPVVKATPQPRPPVPSPLQHCGDVSLTVKGTICREFDVGVCLGGTRAARLLKVLCTVPSSSAGVFLVCSSAAKAWKLDLPTLQTEYGPLVMTA